MAKYKITDETKIVNGTILHRIVATKNFDNVKVGDKGVFVESIRNLSDSFNSWISDNACVFGNAYVLENAQVSGNAMVYGNAHVAGSATVTCNYIIRAPLFVCAAFSIPLYEVVVYNDNRRPSNGVKSLIYILFT